MLFATYLHDSEFVTRVGQVDAAAFVSVPDAFDYGPPVANDFTANFVVNQNPTSEFFGRFEFGVPWFPMTALHFCL